MKKNTVENKHVSLVEKQKTLDRIGQTPVQFSVTVEQFVTLFGATKLAYDKVEEEWKTAGQSESATLIHMTKRFPMSTLNRVVWRDKIQRYLKLMKEINESHKTD